MKAVALALAALAVASVAHADWQRERWVVEPFTWALGGGPDSGPVAGVGDSVHSMCGDGRGNLFLMSGQRIDIVTPEGDRVPVAGTGDMGNRDGPAQYAQFRLGEGAYYGAKSLSCGPDGAVYIADSGNHSIRRLAKEGGEWRVATYGGGGAGADNKRRGNGGERGAFAGTLAVAVNAAGEVIVADNFGAYRIGVDRRVTNLGRWPDSAAMHPGRGVRLNPMMGDADRVGNVYFVSRSPDVVIRVDAQGRIEHMAGIVVTKPPKPLHIGDGPPREAFFDTPTSIAAAPDGSAVFVCGGDEYAIRRVPTDPDGTTATMLQNGRWARLSVHPNKVRGYPLVRRNATGKAKPEGDLAPMTVNHIVGRDAEGNLYGRLTRWMGMSPEIEGSGPLPTRVFRLRRTGGLIVRRHIFTFGIAVAVVTGSVSAQQGVLRADPPFEIAKVGDRRPQRSAALAYDGAGTFLVAWQQGQRYFQQQDADILAVRVDASGRVLDRDPIVVTRAAGSQELPDVAFSNGAFLVVWQDFRSGKHWDVYGARIGVDGRVLDVDGFALATNADNQALPQVAAAPGGYLVVWQALRKGYYRIEGAFVDRAAAASTFALERGGTPLYGGDPALTRVKSGWLLAWRDDKAWAVTGAAVITRRFTVVSGSPAKPSVGEVQRAPAIWLGGAGGRFVSGGDRALYTSAEVGGRGQRVWTSVLLDGATAASLVNPNSERAVSRMSGWDTTRMIPVATAGATYDGPVAGEWACDSFVLVAGETQEAKRGNGVLFAARLGRDGKRLDPEGHALALVEAPVSLANPVLRAGSEAGLLVYEERDHAGRSVLRGRMLHCGGR